MSSAITETGLYSESGPSWSVPIWQEDTETPRALLPLRPGPQKELASAQDGDCKEKDHPHSKLAIQTTFLLPTARKVLLGVASLLPARLMVLILVHFCHQQVQQFDYLDPDEAGDFHLRTSRTENTVGNSYIMLPKTEGG